MIKLILPISSKMVKMTKITVNKQALNVDSDGHPNFTIIPQPYSK